MRTTGGLGHLRVLDGGEGVGESRPGRHRRHAGPAGQARHGVGGEDGGRLVAGVDHPDAAALGAHEDGRDVPAAEGEEEGDALGLQDRRHDFAAVHCLLQILVPPVTGGMASGCSAPVRATRSVGAAFPRGAWERAGS